MCELSIGVGTATTKNVAPASARGSDVNLERGRGKRLCVYFARSILATLQALDALDVKVEADRIGEATGKGECNGKSDVTKADHRNPLIHSRVSMQDARPSTNVRSHGRRVRGRRSRSVANLVSRIDATGRAVGTGQVGIRRKFDRGADEARVLKEAPREAGQLDVRPLVGVLVACSQKQKSSHPASRALHRKRPCPRPP